MTFTDAEERFLASQRLGRLATVAASGTPQVKPVGFIVNTLMGTVDITGIGMAQSAKYKNVQANPKVAFVVDEVLGDEQGVRFLEIRGVAEAVHGDAPAGPGLDPEVIRIRPLRVLSLNIEPENPGFQARDINHHR